MSRCELQFRARQRITTLSAILLAMVCSTMSGITLCRAQESDADEVPSLVSARDVWAAARSPDGGSLVLRDDFANGPFLDWQIVRPQPDHVSFTRNPGCLTITTQRGTIHGDEENDEVSRGIKAKNLFLIPLPPANEAQTSVTLHVRQFEPEASYQQVGLIFYNDDDNYLKWSLERNTESSRLNLVLVRETNEQPQHGLIVEAAAGWSVRSARCQAGERVRVRV